MKRLTRSFEWRRRGSETVAPSTALRAVPLPRCAGADAGSAAATEFKFGATYLQSLIGAGLAGAGRAAAATGADGGDEGAGAAADPAGVTVDGAAGTGAAFAV